MLLFILTINNDISSYVNKDLRLKAKVKAKDLDLKAKAKDFGFKAKAKDTRCQR